MFCNTNFLIFVKNYMLLVDYFVFIHKNEINYTSTGTTSSYGFQYLKIKTNCKLYNMLWSYLGKLKSYYNDVKFSVNQANNGF